MPAGDCLQIFNLIPSEYGLRSRLGWREWVTGLSGANDERVRTMVPFRGGRQSGSTDKLFATTDLGVYDVTASTNSPSLVVAFPITSNAAGYGVSCVVSTPAGRFLLLCDEENGLYVYTEASTTWAAVPIGTTQTWAASTAYLVGNKVVKLSKIYTCTSAGTSGATGPTGTGTGIADGGAVWSYVSASTSGAIGPSLADQQAGLTLDPRNLANVTVWKSRVWLTEKDTSRAWYLDVNAVAGTATSFDFGARMRSGGPLVGLYGWSYDGGAGLDTLLVALSTAGDVVIYQGTDPTSASSFGLKGTWFVSGVPAGRRVATDYGGDVLIMSLQGVVPLSKLVIGNPVVDRSQYATSKIANLFAQLAGTYGGLSGWELIIHPADNALVILVPTQEPLAMAFSTRGWCRYRDLPMVSSAAWNGTLYFGTADGRVCVNTDYVDGVTLADPTTSVPVTWTLLTAYSNLGSSKQKQVQSIRTTLLSGAPAGIVAVAKYGYDLDEDSSDPSDVSLSSAAKWDVALWDVGVWAGGYVPSQESVGAAGMGRDVALYLKGHAVTRTVLVGVDVLYTEGGYL